MFGFDGMRPVHQASDLALIARNTLYETVTDMQTAAVSSAEYALEKTEKVVEMQRTLRDLIAYGEAVFRLELDELLRPDDNFLKAI